MTRDELLEAMRALIEAAADEPLAEEEAERYEQLEKQLAVLDKDIEIRARQKAYETPGRTDLHVHTGTPAPADEERAQAFDRYLRNPMDRGLQAEFRAQSVGTDSAGGFTVPEVFRQKLVDRLVNFGGLANEVEVITTTGGEDMRWPTLDDTANRGVIAAENAAPGSSGADMVFGEITLGAFKYVAPGASNLPLRVSVELLQDSAFDIQSLVARKLGERIARLQAEHWVTGNGTTEPFGIDTSSGPSQVFAGATPTKNDFIDALHDVDPDYRGNAVWAFDDPTLALVEKLEDTTGRPLLQPYAASGIDGNISQGRMLLGHRVVIDQAFPSYTDGVAQVFGVFGDLREGYVIRRVRDVQLIVDPYTRMNEGQVQYSVWARADGNVQNPNAFTTLENAV
jgi:HK97 family phage major capsid protein